MSGRIYKNPMQHFDTISFDPDKDTNMAIADVVKTKLLEIAAQCKALGLNENLCAMLQDSYIDQVKRIDFSECPVQGFKAIIGHEELSNYIREQNTLLGDAAQFVYQYAPMLHFQLTMRTKVNGFLYDELIKFTQAQLKELDEEHTQHCFGPEVGMQVKFAYISELAKIDYLSSYVRRRSLRKDTKPHDMKALCLNARKRIYHDSNIDADSFKEFIFKESTSRGSQIMDLENLSNFYLAIIGGDQNKKDALIETIIEIDQTIRNYTKQQKGKLVSKFRDDLGKLLTELRQCFDEDTIATYPEKVSALLSTLEQSEKAHYESMRLFAETRQANSTLMGRITDAKTLLVKFERLYSEDASSDEQRQTQPPVLLVTAAR